MDPNVTNNLKKIKKSIAKKMINDIIIASIQEIMIIIGIMD